MKILILFALLLVTPAEARMTKEVADRWEKYQLTPAQKGWFERQRAAFGHCCDIADGLPADDWERRGDGHYWALLDGKWWQVPDANVLHDGNPVGVPVVWFTTAKDAIRCFAPGPEN